MWWTIFTIVDLYIGVVVLDAMASSLPAEKLGRVRIVRRVVLALMAVCGVVLIVQISIRYGWLRF